MGNVQWSEQLVATQIVSVTSEKTNYEATRLTELKPRPLIRQWRSNDSLAQQDIVFDLGSSLAIKGTAVLNVNVPQIELAHAAASGGPWTNYSGVPFTVGQYTPRPYRHTFTAENFTDRYLRLRIPGSQSPFDGEAYLAAGFLAVVTSLNTLTMNPEDWQDEALRPDRLRLRLRAAPPRRARSVRGPVGGTG